jgi:hypothetical protein
MLTTILMILVIGMIPIGITVAIFEIAASRALRRSRAGSP